MATDSIALEWSLEPENCLGHRLKLLSSGLCNSKFALTAERVYAMVLSCAFVYLFFTQDVLIASITEISWSWLVCTERQQSRLSKRSVQLDFRLLISISA